MKVSSVRGAVVFLVGAGALTVQLAFGSSGCVLFGNGGAGTQTGSGPGASGGAPTTGSGAMCGVNFGAGCDACIAQSCCSLFETCDQDPSCLTLDQCIGACAQGDMSCIDTCSNAASSATIQTYNTAVMCAQANCQAACFGGGTGGSSGTSTTGTTATSTTSTTATTSSGTTCTCPVSNVACPGGDSSQCPGMSCAQCTGQYTCVQDNGLDWCTIYVNNQGCQHLVGGCPGACQAPGYCPTGCCQFESLPGDFAITQGNCVDASMCP